MSHGKHKGPDHGTRNASCDGRQIRRKEKPRKDYERRQARRRGWQFPCVGAASKAQKNLWWEEALA